MRREDEFILDMIKFFYTDSVTTQASCLQYVPRPAEYQYTEYIEYGWASLIKRHEPNPMRGKAKSWNQIQVTWFKVE